MCRSVCVLCLPARVLSVYCRLYCPAVREMRRTERFTIMKHCVEYLTHTRTRIDTHTYAQNSRLHPYLSHSALSEVSVGAYLDRGRALGPVRWQPWKTNHRAKFSASRSHASRVWAAARLRGSSHTAPVSRSAAGHNREAWIQIGTEFNPLLSILLLTVLERLSKVNYCLRTNYLGGAASGGAHLQSPLSVFCSVLM